MCHVCDEENASTHVKFMLCCCKICFVAIYALLCGGKINQKLCVWRKNNKYEVWPQYVRISVMKIFTCKEIRQI